MDKTPLVTGLFDDRDSAERAYQSVTTRGYDSSDINLVMSDDARKRHFGSAQIKTELGNKAAEGAGVGGAVGGTVGAIAAAIAALGTTLLIPGLGLVIAGPLAAAVAGAGAGAATGGLIGALVGWNIPEARVKEYESALKEGKILMAVQPRNTDDASHFQKIWTGTTGMTADTNGIRAHMKVMGMDRQPVGTVDHIDGGRIKLAKTDSLANGEHHWIPKEWIDSVEEGMVCLSKNAQEARAQWQSK